MKSLTTEEINAYVVLIIRHLVVLQQLVQAQSQQLIHTAWKLSKPLMGSMITEINVFSVLQDTFWQYKVEEVYVHKHKMEMENWYPLILVLVPLLQIIIGVLHMLRLIVKEYAQSHWIKQISLCGLYLCQPKFPQIVATILM